MSASISRPVQQSQRCGRLWWLPPGGQGNGLDDEAWAPILEVGPGIVTPLLAALLAAGVPAYAASTQAGPSRRRARAAAPCDYRVWVGTSAYSRAVDTLVAVMPALLGQPHGHGTGTRT
jgi:hypothetical protein